MNVAETLRRAVEIAETLDHCKGSLRGWAKDAEGLPVGPPIACCTLGAISIARDEAADRGESSSIEPFFIVEKVLGRNVADWNDQIRTTKEDVVKALKQAVKVAEANDA